MTDGLYKNLTAGWIITDWFVVFMGIVTTCIHSLDADDYSVYIFVASLWAVVACMCLFGCAYYIIVSQYLKALIAVWDGVISGIILILSLQKISGMLP